jgi:hypothetical protein
MAQWRLHRELQEDQFAGSLEQEMENVVYQFGFYFCPIC